MQPALQIEREYMKHMKWMYWVPGLFSLGLLSACAQQLEQVNRDLTKLNSALASGLPNNNAGATGVGLAAIAAPQTMQTQLTVPSNKDVEAAFNAALPNIKKVISVHQCMKSYIYSRFLSNYTVIGEENRIFQGAGYYVPLATTKYHDNNKCVSVRAIDQITLPALNALKFRVIYLAEDSGEASNFTMQFTKVDDGSWKLSRIADSY